MIKVAVDKKRSIIYASEIFYKSGNSTEQLVQLIKSNVHPANSLIVADSADPRTINDLRIKNFNAIPATKGPDSVRNGIKRLQDYEIIVTSTSTNLIKELRNYVWHDKKSEMPIDAYNHQIDPLRYAFDKLVPQSTMYISGM
jgi:phage terminase large subunit